MSKTISLNNTEYLLPPELDLHPLQQKYFQFLLNSRYEENYLVCGRNWGKDFLLRALVIYLFTTKTEDIRLGRLGAKKRYTICYIDHSIDNCLKFLDSCKAFFDKDTISSNFRGMHNKSHTVSLYVYSSNSIELLRGKNEFDITIVNEAQSIPDEDYFSVISPLSMSSTKEFRKRIIACTPKGLNWVYSKVNQFKTYPQNTYISLDPNDPNSAKRDISGEYILDDQGRRIRQYPLLTAPTDSNPYIKPEVIEAFRREMDHGTFQREIMGRFVFDKGKFFEGVEQVFTVDFETCRLPKNKLVIGVDVGTETDNTVLTLLGADARIWNYAVIQPHELRGDGKTARLCEKIYNFAKANGMPRVVIETNGIGRLAYDILKNTYCNPAHVDKYDPEFRVEGFVTNMQTKLEGLEKIRATMAMGILKAPRSYIQLQKEFNAFSVDFRNGTPVYEKNGIDDAIMSLVIAIVPIHDQISKTIRDRRILDSEIDQVRNR